MGLFDSPSHIIIVLVVLVLLFGSAKLPKLAKSLGESMRIFKSETQKLHTDDKPVQGQVQQQPFTQPELPVQPPVANQQPETQRTNQPG
jgi:sec-independent protein translocase protein TatA